MSILEQLIQENKELKKKIEELEKEIILLRTQLQIERIPKFVKPDNNHKHKKTGQKNGHKGYARNIPERIDKIKELKINKCPYCNGKSEQRQETINLLNRLGFNYKRTSNIEKEI